MKKRQKEAAKQKQAEEKVTAKLLSSKQINCRGTQTIHSDMTLTGVRLLAV